MLFRIIGLVVGFMGAGFVGALFGFFAGGFLDRFLAFGLGAVNPLTSQKRQAVFIKTVFSLMGKLAKADGHISREEIQHVEQFMSQLGMTAEHRKEAIEIFKSGTEPEFEIEPVLQEFLAVCGQTHNLRQVLLVYLVGVAMADDQLHAEEENLLRRIAFTLGFDEASFEQLISMIRGQNHFAGGQVPSANDLKDAYAALGVTEDQTDPEIKKAYRRLMSEFHPDKLIGQGLPDDMIKVATERSQEIQKAYELVKKSRQA